MILTCRSGLWPFLAAARQRRKHGINGGIHGQMNRRWGIATIDFTAKGERLRAKGRVLLNGRSTR